jgi:hypothetical protein
MMRTILGRVQRLGRSTTFARAGALEQVQELALREISDADLDALIAILQRGAASLAELTPEEKVAGGPQQTLPVMLINGPLGAFLSLAAFHGIIRLRPRCGPLSPGPMHE